MRRNFYSKGLILIAAVAFIIACSPKSNYNTLSVFFDGVPDPDAIDSTAIADSIKLEKTSNTPVIVPVTPQFVFHPPYREKECAN